VPKKQQRKRRRRVRIRKPNGRISKCTAYIQCVVEAKKEEEKPQEPATAEIKPNKKILIEVKVDKKPLGVIVTGGKNNNVKVP